MVNQVFSWQKSWSK